MSGGRSIVNRDRVDKRRDPAAYFSVFSREIELMQYLRPVGAGPSSKTWPRCASHLLQRTSVRLIKRLLSVSVLTLASDAGAKKLGHPVPESNFASESKSVLP